MDDSPGDSIMKLDNDHSIRMGDFALDEPAESAPEERSGRSSMFTVIVSGLALLSDGYNAQISMVAIRNPRPVSRKLTTADSILVQLVT